MKTLALAATAAALLAGTAAFAADSAQYQVQIDATWTQQTHAYDYPGNAHFSGMVGATHDGSYRVFADGATATPGLEALAERGAHSPLDKEIRATIESGKAGALFESGALFSFPGKLTSTFTADDAHPFVSVGAMVAPSPDWFTGVSNVSLRENGKWVDRLTLNLFVYDAGTDSGTTHQADDDDTQPRQNVRLNASPQFMGNDGLKPVGTITFTRMKQTASK